MSSVTVYLAIVNIMACSLIGLSTMISLYVFNIFMKRPLKSVTNQSQQVNNCVKYLNDLPQNSSTPLSKSSFSSYSCSSLSSTSSSPLSGASSKIVSNINEPKKEIYHNKWMKKLLAFAIGGLLGDVFLHLLPEAASQLASLNYTIFDIQRYLGVWIVMGVVIFLVFETYFTQLFSNDHDDAALQAEMSIKVTGYMNLMANAFDNFSHGMSVGASFLVSYKAGCLTTLAIIIHEIPHEIADHTILIRSGFSIWEAFKAQMSICLVTIFGAIVVLICGSTSDTINLTLWILPLTAGGFIYIALTTLLPEVLDFSDIDCTIEKKYSKLSPKLIKCKAISQRILFLLSGIFVMATMNVFDLF